MLDNPLRSALLQDPDLYPCDLALDEPVLNRDEVRELAVHIVLGRDFIFRLPSSCRSSDETPALDVVIDILEAQLTAMWLLGRLLGGFADVPACQPTNWHRVEPAANDHYHRRAV